MSKKPWKSPQLIVLVRGKLEENVLSVCKAAPRGKPSNPCMPNPGRPLRRLGKS
jgi:hypothetical protein